VVPTRFGSQGSNLPPPFLAESLCTRPSALLSTQPSQRNGMGILPWTFRRPTIKMLSDGSFYNPAGIYGEIVRHA